LNKNVHFLLVHFLVPKLSLGMNSGRLCLHLQKNFMFFVRQSLIVGIPWLSQGTRKSKMV
jgi:hypothetical protein